MNIPEKVRIATAKLAELMQVDKNTHAVIVSVINLSEEHGLQVGLGFYQAVIERGGKATLVTQSPRTWHEPRDIAVNNLLSDTTYNLLFVTDIDTLGFDPVGREKTYTLGKDTYNEIIYYRKAKKDTRAFWFMVKDMDNWINSITVDYDELGRISSALEQAFLQTKTVRIRTGVNAVLEFETKKQNHPVSDYGPTITELGHGCNIPFGEVFIGPDNTTARGKIILDGSMFLDDTVTLKKPITITFKDGRVTAITGGKEAAVLKDYIKGIEKETQEGMSKSEKVTPLYMDNIYRIGEFAIGVNKSAIFCDDLLIDEKVYGTAHIALGRSYHGDPAFMHVDIIARQPEVIFIGEDGLEKVIVKNGKVLI